MWILKRILYSMTKKNLSLRRNSENDVLGYRLPVYHESGTQKYVDFYCFDPSRGAMRRKKIHLDKYRKKSERRLHANLLITTLSDKLRKGWNPWCEASADREYTSISDILVRYVEYVEKTCRTRTQENYRSRVNVFREYNEGRFRPIRYAYEFDHAFCTEFLDYVLLDRDSGARTRNNYRQWLYSFGEWMISRRYIKENPAEGIKKLAEDPKKRQPLTKPMMRQLTKYLEESDRYFLLACLMEYYTLIRPTELSNIRIKDIHLKDQYVFVSGEFSKNKRDGKVGLNQKLVKLMLDLGTFNHPGEWLLFGKHFHPSTKKEDADQFNKKWVSVRKKLGWGDEYQFYSLKDTGIRDLANAAGIVVARDQARHSDIATTNKYLGRNRDVHRETQEFKGALDED